MRAICDGNIVTFEADIELIKKLVSAVWDLLADSENPLDGTMRDECLQRLGHGAVPAAASFKSTPQAAWIDCRNGNAGSYDAL